MDWLKKLQAVNEAETQAKQHAVIETANTLWRWFTLEADRIFKSSPKTADSWDRHKEHKIAAGTLCTVGNISAAKVELEKALTALQGATITQPNLL